MKHIIIGVVVSVMALTGLASGIAAQSKACPDFKTQRKQVIRQIHQEYRERWQSLRKQGQQPRGKARQEFKSQERQAIQDALQQLCPERKINQENQKQGEKRPVKSRTRNRQPRAPRTHRQQR